jgi:ribosomal protein S18 acetylase RimI-like enzyme
MKLRLLEKKDIRACAAIVGVNYSKEYEISSEAELESMFSNAAVTPIYWVAEEKKEIVGFAGYIQSWMDYNVYQIFWVNVSPTYQRKGIGKKLVAKIISEIKKNKKAYLIQLTATPSNAKYYRQHFGFKSRDKIGSAGPNQYHVMSLHVNSN